MNREIEEALRVEERYMAERLRRVLFEIYGGRKISDLIDDVGLDVPEKPTVRDPGRRIEPEG